jgi:hypothetical protein
MKISLVVFNYWTTPFCPEIKNGFKNQQTDAF